MRDSRVAAIRSKILTEVGKANSVAPRRLFAAVHQSDRTVSPMEVLSVLWRLVGTRQLLLGRDFSVSVAKGPTAKRSRVSVKRAKVTKRKK